MPPFKLRVEFFGRIEGSRSGSLSMKRTLEILSDMGLTPLHSPPFIIQAVEFEGSREGVTETKELLLKRLTLAAGMRIPNHVFILRKDGKNHTHQIRNYALVSTHFSLASAEKKFARLRVKKHKSDERLRIVEVK